MKPKRLLQTAFAALTVSALAACSLAGGDEAGTQAHLQQLLQGADSGSVVSLVMGDTLIVSDATIRFYRDRKFRPVWSEGDKLNEQGKKLAQVLASTERDGLNPLRYRFDVAQKMTIAFENEEEGELSEELEARYGGELDLLLTEGFTRYALDLATGTLDPKQGGLKWNIPRGAVPKENLLRALSKGEDPEEIIEQVRPTAPQYRRLMHVLSRLHDARKGGGWQPVQAGDVAPGDSSPVVAALRARLMKSEDQREAAMAARGQQRAMVYDQDLQLALKHFQERHGIDGDGRIGEKTLEELNHGVDDRIAEVKLNLDRWRWLPHDLGKMYIMVNVAGFEMSVVENNRAIEEMNVVVGKPSWATPIFADTLESIVVNPYWNVPPSIAQEEVLPAIAQDPGYLERNNMERTSDGGFRQRPGPKNALGEFKFLFPNEHDVYLHDTPADALFSRSSRAFSHGCIRVERPRDLAYLLGSKLAKKSPEQIDRLAATGSEQWISVKRKIPVYVLYFTTWVDDDGTVRYHHDIYKIDEQFDDQRVKFEQRA
ncbi:MAG TPA: L,D-transpeptidase family protein [Longimicrobiales bacterium]